MLKGNHFFSDLDIFGFYSMQRFIHVDESMQVEGPRQDRGYKAKESEFTLRHLRHHHHPEQRTWRAFS
jgi:hypothetical protein